jgi:hypothetical protein
MLILLMLVLSIGLLSEEIMNPDKPLKGDWDLKAEKVWEVTNYGKKAMAVPTVGAVSDDGTICVYDCKYWVNYLLDKDGNYIGKFGKRGEGPGEIKSQMNMFSVNDKFIISSYLRINYFTKKGKYVKTDSYTRSLGFPKTKPPKPLY